ncbi:MAG: NADH-quinone oxidoreductase subunit J, partial [Chloroflexota bacterium]
MTELLFALMGLFAVGCAIAMLLSENAVHSALFLIGTMFSIAFMFLLLDAPFLAMIQITVYTGAIMVLFLFVIMLLGSEKVQDDVTPEVRRSRRRFTLIASGLAAALLVLVGIPLSNVNLDLATETGELPQVRALHVAPDLGAVNVYANDQLIASDLEFDQNSSYVTLNPGDYALRVEPVAGGDPLTTNVTLQRGTEQTLIA